MSDRLRFGQIGISHTHATKCVTDTFRALLEKLNVEFTGIHEPDPEMWKARHGRKEYSGVRWLDSADELLNDATINAISSKPGPGNASPGLAVRCWPESTSTSTSRPAFLCRIYDPCSILTRAREKRQEILFSMAWS